MLKPQPDGTVAIRTGTGFYWTAVNGGGWGENDNRYPIHTNATQRWVWETFTVIQVAMGWKGIHLYEFVGRSAMRARVEL